MGVHWSFPVNISRFRIGGGGGGWRGRRSLGGGSEGTGEKGRMGENDIFGEG